jgi:rsbT co-antagonist protein RsbR
MLLIQNVLSTVHSVSADIQRRGRNLIILACGMSVLALAYLPLTLGGENSWTAVPTLVVAALVFIGVAFLGRVGQVDLGSWILISMALVTILGFTLTSTAASSVLTTPFYLVLPILLAGALLPPAQIWAVLVLCVGGLALLVGLASPDLTPGADLSRNALSSSLMLVMVAAIAFVSARGTSQALNEAQAAREESDAANQALVASNDSLEVRVAERTAELARIIAERQTAAEALQASLQAQQDLNRVIADLAVPVIPVRHDTLIVPLVGNIDSARADQILSLVLTRVERDGARRVVLDVTGVAVVDTQVSAALLRVAAATRLMGAQVTLAGIRPEVAQSLVGLGVDLRELRTVSTLQDALA